MKFATDPSGSVPWVQGGFKSELGLSLDKELVKNLILVAGGLELGGGLLIALGLEAYGAALLATFLVAVTPVLHNPARKTGKDLQETQVRFRADGGSGTSQAFAAVLLCRHALAFP